MATMQNDCKNAHRMEKQLTIMLRVGRSLIVQKS